MYVYMYIYIYVYINIYIIYVYIYAYIRHEKSGIIPNPGGNQQGRMECFLFEPLCTLPLRPPFRRDFQALGGRRDFQALGGKFS